MADLQELANYVINGKAQETKDLVAKALEEGVSVEDILNLSLIHI